MIKAKYGHFVFYFHFLSDSENRSDWSLAYLHLNQHKTLKLRFYSDVPQSTEMRKKNGGL